MTTSDTTALAASFLSVVSDSEREALLAAAVIEDWPAGRFVFHPPLAVVESGLLRSYVADRRGRQLTVAYVSRSEAVGLMPLSGRAFPVAFQALSDARLLHLDVEQVLRMKAESSELAWATALEVTRRYDDLLAETARVAFGSIPARVAYHLVAMTSLNGGHPVRQDDLVLAVGSVRDVVRRAVVECRGLGLVSTVGGLVAVVDQAGLRRLGSDVA